MTKSELIADWKRSYYSDGERLYNKASNRVAAIDPLLLEAIKKQVMITQEEIRDALRRPESTQDEIPAHPSIEEVVAHTLKKFHATEVNGTYYTESGALLGNTELENKVRIFLDDMYSRAPKGFRPWGDKIIGARLNEYLGKMPDRLLGEAKAALKYKPYDILGAATRLMELMGVPEDLATQKPFSGEAHTIAGYREASAIMLLHWMWQVKRNLYNLPTVWQTMINFYGDKQGGGKSYTIKNYICMPFGKIRRVVSTSLDQLQDGRGYRMLSDYYVVFFDELAQKSGGMDDNNRLKIFKACITEAEISGRPMQNNKVEMLPKVCTFISASNIPISHVFSDETGMRRFFEIITTEDFSDGRLAEIDWYALWAGIDENSEVGYWKPKEEIGQRIIKIQNTYYPHTAIHQWFESGICDYLPVPPEDFKVGFEYLHKTPSEMWQDFLLWAETDAPALRYKSPRNFYEKLKQIGCHTTAKGYTLRLKGTKATNENLLGL